MSELQKIGADDTHPDYFTFDVSKGRQIGQGTRSKAIAYLGPTIYERFGIDIAVGTNMTQTPETIAPIEPIQIPGIDSPNYLGYPTVDHIADKHAAMLETHNGEPSSRYRDLYDLVIFATTAQIDAGQLCTALLSEYEHRGLKPPTEIQLPSPKWIAGYESLDKPSSITEQTTDQAVTLIRKFLEPVLNGLTIGTWNPASQSWETD